MTSKSPGLSGTPPTLESSQSIGYPYGLGIGSASSDFIHHPGKGIEPMAIFWGLAAAFGFGVADLFAREATQREGVMRSQFYLAIVGLVLIAIYLAFSGDVLWSAITSPHGLLAAGTSIGFMIGGVLLYQSLATGPLLIVSPITSSFAAITTITAFIAGERLPALRVIGIVITIIGVILSAAAPPNPEHQQAGPQMDNRLIERFLPRWLPAGIALAAGTALIFGIGNWFLSIAISEIGAFTTVLINKIVGVSVYSVVFLARRIPVVVRQASSWKWVLPLGFIDTVSFLAFTMGLEVGAREGLVSVVTVCSSLFAVVTVILGAIFWKERITTLQTVGIVITFVGVALVSI